MAATRSRSSRQRHDRRLPLLLALATLVAALTAAPAFAGPAIPADPGAAPQLLPAPVASAASAKAGPRWLVGVRAGHPRLAALAARHGGRVLPQLDIVSLPRERAHALAADLGDALRWAAPAATARRASSFELGGGAVSEWSRPTLALPASGPQAPIGIVDDLVDPLVAELAGVTQINTAPITDGHGTMVASVAAAPLDGRGVVGVAPGARVLSYGTDLDCGDVATGITRLARRGARVINVSLVFELPCPAVTEAIAFAYARGATVVAASGNDGDALNPRTWPASSPHVITVGAADAAGQIPRYSARSRWVDLVAPGVDVPAAVQPAFDGDDGVKDGLTAAGGTSLATPAVSGAVAWVLGARPGLDPHQVAGLLRGAAIDRLTPGWDTTSGFGSLQVGGALAAPAPVKDPLEPNETPAFVRPAGQGHFAKRTLWSGGAPVALAATADSSDDPLDGYRVTIPARGRATVRLQVQAGAVDLYAFDRSVKSFTGTPSLAASTRPAAQTETLTLRNRTRSARSVFVVAHAPAAVGRVLSAYHLSISR